jgi:2-phosphosulfolactate phosphatase
MDVRIDSLLAGASRAEGTVVVIDVYRAFTTACILIERGARHLLLTADIEDALRLRRQRAGDCCVGEVGGAKPEQFDFGNSPHEILEEDFSGRTPILSTRAGTVGVNAAWHAERLYGASLVNAGATARVIRAAAPSQVTLVAMGWQGRIRADEDELCAVYLKNLILGEQPDAAAVTRFIAGCAESRKFDDPAQPHFHRRDREVALQVDRVDFALRVRRRDQMWVARPESLPAGDTPADVLPEDV